MKRSEIFIEYWNYRPTRKRPTVDQFNLYDLSANRMSPKSQESFGFSIYGESVLWCVCDNNAVGFCDGCKGHWHWIGWVHQTANLPCSTNLQPPDSNLFSIFFFLKNHHKLLLQLKSVARWFHFEVRLQAKHTVRENEEMCVTFDETLNAWSVY